MSFANLEESAKTFDSEDPLSTFRSRFELPSDVIYLDGNSLGPMLKSVPDRVETTLRHEWAEGLIRSWNDADWINITDQVATRIAPLIGATPESVTVTDSTSINLFKLLSAALKMNSERNEIVSLNQNFPTDLYIAQGLRDFLDSGHKLQLAKKSAEISGLISDKTAMVMLTHVDFRTGEMLDMEKITQKAHEHGALVIWDLAHSAGAVPVHLDDVEADFAVGCGYKYLNGGPGAPSFLYVNKKHIGKAIQPITGWFSHASPFSFEADYKPDRTIKQFQSGTPPILSMIALDESLKLWQEVEIEQIREKSLKLTDFFIDCINTSELDNYFENVTPLSHSSRGSHVSLSFDGDGYAVMQAIIEQGVIGDFRTPDILRFGFAPLYNTFTEVSRSVEILHEIMSNKVWKEERFSQRKAVT